MSEISFADIRKIKTALRGARGRRLDRQRAAELSLPTRVRNADSGRAAAKLLSPALTDRATARAFAALVASDDAKLAAGLKRLKADAIRKSREGQRGLRAQAAQRVRGLEAVVSSPLTGGTQYELLTEPFLIWPTNSIDLEASEIVPANSSAKFRARITEGKSFYGDVKFYYIWRNPRSTFAVVHVDGYAIFHGYAYVGVGGGLFPASRSARATVDGRLDILEWYNQPPTQPATQPDQSVSVANLSVSAGGFSEVGAIDWRDIYRGYDLRHTFLLVPPSAVLLFVVTAAVSLRTGSDSGYAEVDFASGAFNVGSPAVLVAVVS
jgi:hypothetical protein